jgi:hypothetical protein
MYGVPYDVFYQRDRPVEVENAVVVFRTNSKYNTARRVLEYFEIADSFDFSARVRVFEYGPVRIVTVPAK